MLNHVSLAVIATLNLLTIYLVILFEINAYAFMVWPALRRFRASGQAPSVDLA